MRIKDSFFELEAICGKNAVLTDVPMKEHTTIRVGGNADVMLLPDSVDKIQRAVSFLNMNRIPYMVIGNGSNIIFPDEGYNGVIIKIGPGLSEIKVENNTIEAEAGASLADVAKCALQHSLTGLEFAAGIPGSIGGAAFMNAGAYEGEMKQVITRTLCVGKLGQLVTLEGSENSFSYRHSRIQNDGLICVKVVLTLNKGDFNAIQDRMNELNSRRRDRQPLNLPSAGSVFKRPLGNYAGKLIEDCGLRGFSIGGAQVSDKHCGFIVNKGNATSTDIIALIKHIQKTVHEKTGVMLESEVRIIGRT